MGHDHGDTGVVVMNDQIGPVTGQLTEDAIQRLSEKLREKQALEQLVNDLQRISQTIEDVQKAMIEIGLQFSDACRQAIETLAKHKSHKE